MKLRYVGITPVTFITAGVGEVGPGEEFTVPDEIIEAFLGRGDVEEVVEDDVVAKVAPVKSPRKRPRGEEPGQSVTTDGGDPEKMSEENSGVPNDH